MNTIETPSQTLERLQTALTYLQHGLKEATQAALALEFGPPGHEFHKKGARFAAHREAEKVSSSNAKPGKLLRVSKVAKALQVTPGTIYKGIRSGAIPHIRVGRSILITEEWLTSALVGGVEF